MTPAKPTRRRLDVPVTAIAGGLVLAFVLAGVLLTDAVAAFGQAGWTFLSHWFGWVYVLSTVGFVFFLLYIAFTRFGTIKLSEDDEEPEFSTVSWIAMMFAIGVGIGLIFYGAAEPVLLWNEPPPDTVPARTQEAAENGMAYALFHWCLHPWAFFGVTGLALAYATYRKRRPTLISETYRPLFGDRAQADRVPGRILNILVIIATLFGNAVTLGLGVLQISRGISYIGGPDPTLGGQALITAVLTVAFVLSAVAGIARGVQLLANVNMVLAAGLLVFLLVTGPLALILAITPEALGAYLSGFLGMSFQTGAFGGAEWMRSWTLFFWAWGIAWAPYVGTFLARVSRGRTIREYIFGVLILPSVITLIWFSVIGGTALDLQLSGRRDIAAAAAEQPEAALFDLLASYPLPIVTSIAVIALAAIFFVAGADAGAIVLGTFSSRGSLRPARWLTTIWGTLIGAVAIVLLLVGGLEALQWAAIIAASPFVLILVGMCIALSKDMLADPAVRGQPVRLDQGRAPQPELRRYIERVVRRTSGR